MRYRNIEYIFLNIKFIYKNYIYDRNIYFDIKDHPPSVIVVSSGNSSIPRYSSMSSAMSKCKSEMKICKNARTVQATTATLSNTLK